MTDTDWSLISFDEPVKVRPPALTVYQELDRPPQPEPKRRGWPKGKPRKQPE
jgi:hypothetical protein